MSIVLLVLPVVLVVNATATLKTGCNGKYI
jgi:hypothetical protein